MLEVPCPVSAYAAATTSPVLTYALLLPGSREGGTLLHPHRVEKVRCAFRNQRRQTTKTVPFVLPMSSLLHLTFAEQGGGWFRPEEGVSLQDHPEERGAPRAFCRHMAGVRCPF